MYHFFIGIDISKKDFVLSIVGQPKTITFQNNLTGFRRLLRKFPQQLKSGFVVLETTGGYDMLYSVVSQSG